MSNQRMISTTAVPDVCTYTILSGGTKISSTYHVLSITVASEVNRIPTATIVLADGDPAKETFEVSDKPDFLPGKSIEIKAGYRSVETSLFKGIVVRHSIKIRQNGSLLIVECKDKAVKMTVGTKNKYFIDQKDSEIIEALARKSGLTAQVATTTNKRKGLVQVDQTDWDFLLARANVNGLLVIAENGALKVIKPDFNQSPVETVTFGSSLLELDAEIDAMLQFKSVKARAWSSADQAMVVVDAKTPTIKKQGDLDTADLAKVIDLDYLNIQHGGALPKSELQAAANARFLKAYMSKVRGRASFQGTSKAKPGVMLNLNGVGKHFKGPIFVAGVQHHIGDGNWETNIQFGLETDWFSKAAHKKSSWESGHFFSPVEGLQIGVVTALENDPEGEDRIQIRLPVVDSGAKGIWARVASLDAGNKRGAFFRPEVGDEVVVGFLASDVASPVVLGMLNSSAKPAPITAKNANHEKGFISREQLKWLIDDDKKSITFQTPGGNKIILSDDEKGIQLKDQHGNTIKMDKSGIQISSSGDLKASAAKNAEVGGKTLTLKGQTSLSIDGGSQLALKASGITEIKGSLVKIN